jgi:hypothetical protein
MPLIVTPAQFSHRAELYQQLAQLTAAGIGVPRALDHLEAHPLAEGDFYPGDLLAAVEFAQPGKSRGPLFRTVVQSRHQFIELFHRDSAGLYRHTQNSPQFGDCAYRGISANCDLGIFDTERRDDYPIGLGESVGDSVGSS